ncbi:MAG: ATP-dependent helicase, partial [Halanaerobiales bacterium]
YNDTDQINLLKQIIKEMNLDTKDYNPKQIINNISELKMDLVKPKHYISLLQQQDIRISSFHQNLSNIYTAYEEILKNNNAFDFDDMITKTIYLLKENKDVLERYQQKFKYIQIDEYQDSNHSNYIFAKLLSGPQNNLFVVGDPDQSIYRFRGADINNILEFEEDYKNAQVIVLDTNYRSTKNIVDATKRLIENNSLRKKKNIWPDKGHGNQIVLCENKSPQKEGIFVASTIRRLVRDGYNYNDIAILYRSHYQSQPIENELIKLNIPYQIISSKKFFDREEIKNFLSFLKFVINPDDNLSLTQVMNIFNNDVGPKTIGYMKNHADEKGIRMIDVFENPTIVDGIGKKRGDSIKTFYKEVLIPSFEVSKENISLIKKVEKMYDLLDYETYLNNYEDPQEVKENVNQLLAYIFDYSDKHAEQSLNMFMDDISLLTDRDDVREDQKAVKLMTAHASKGTEHKAVFVVGLEEETFPHYISVNQGTHEDIEEERRLAYVAMTRPKERLFVSYCTSRFKFGKYEQKTPSRFVNELPFGQYKKIVNY